MSEPTFDIPKECTAGVVRNEGPDFYVEVTKVPVPEIGTCTTLQGESLDLTYAIRTRGCPHQAQRYRPLHVRCPLHDERLGTP